jgi:hypothetical protein
MSDQYTNCRSVFHLRGFFAMVSFLAVLLGCAYAQEGVAVPHLVKFTGSIQGAPTSTAGVIFALYKDATGGAPLWQEVQSVTVDATGHYTALLGARSQNGIPLEVFSTNEARWLGVQIQGQPEGPRVLLVSVPYAIKASDAETLGGLPASAFLRSDAQAAAQSGAYINTAAVTSAVKGAVAAISTSGTIAPGNIPMFSDTAGDLSASALYQSGLNVGVGTSAPATAFNIAGQNPTLRVDNYSSTVGDSPNFNFLSARGALGSPQATQSNDNLGQFAAAGYTGSAFPGSKVKVTFLATENWSPTANGTAMTFQTTKNGTTARTERMRIDNTGNVGIGTTTPTSPLTVAGAIQSTAGGYVFPDGTTQTTAGVATAAVCASGQMLKWNGTSWACFTSQAASSLALGSGLTGNITNNLLTLNTDTTYLQQRVTGSCSAGNAIASVSQNGTVSCQTVSGGGAVVLPVNWSAAPNPPATVAGVLNVTNTATGTPAAQNGPPNFAAVPAAIVGTATGSQISAGVSGMATGAEGVGLFGYTSNSTNPSVVAWSALTGYTKTSNGDWPKALDAETMNAGSTVIQASANAGTAPVNCTGNNTPAGCGQTVAVKAQIAATSGQAVLYSGEATSPSATGLQLNFDVPLSSGNMISANVNGVAGTPGAYFNVDGGGNVNTSGSISANGNLSSSGTLSANGINISGNLNVGGGSVNFLTNANFTNGLTASGNASFNGNVYINGTISKNSGTFKIDHPLDPANKYLYHSFVESPDMMNIYNGNIVTNRHGLATVELPSYFEALNQDFRYQLTVIGQFAQAIVVREIDKNHFTIKTNKPSVKVSWQVTGIRHDAYADAHRVQVEEDKGKERGTYLHPELFPQTEPVLAKK